MDVGGGQERPPVDTNARGRDSRGLVKGTYVRGGACVGAWGARVAGSRVNIGGF